MRCPIIEGNTSHISYGDIWEFSTEKIIIMEVSGLELHRGCLM